ncbi:MULTISPECIES: helix-turn-helix transcriptional regulator [unclassified Fusibacter]|uniref:helix-turn-helix transcriptional regulator n=1 Tax=unclassified Fusibacter TaxID=2624464 RepID=UPI00101104D1|nr:MULTISPECIES: helix-turn-helix transcriptional regulator [unclassified Fusibacter]MCK8060035.1 helix-turn-helix transcriptional regulator [Fusibacter sp. A2]NPE22175.1 PadR family transcriptional regulator [Fusibacter sp. A1]RXV60951.1 PadR family transcriptional regulator [Fusibacter sp. A1]
MKNGHCEIGMGSGGRFIQPCILLSLKENVLHGYGLLEKIMEFGFSSEPIDISVIYRQLKKMESEGLITSAWNTDTGGPAKKVYSLTGDGMDALKAYKDFFVHRKEKIEAFLKTFDERMGE